MRLKLSVSKKQKMFIDATESEVLFGGAAGGGKSYGQMVDALLYALRYPSSKQLVLRRTFSELEKSLIRTSLAIFPREIYSFNQSSHTGRFKNGSIIDFGYCGVESDVYQYQSAEYDVIRFDELTHFTEMQYIYLISRVRGANSYPKQIKSSTNPGGVGHSWVKSRFIDVAPPGVRYDTEDGLSRVFIPSLLSDNSFLSRSDPNYRKRLLSLPERERRGLLYGDWNIFEGQYFSEFSERNIIEPFKIPREWRRYRTIDYGLDRLACLWIAVSPEGDFYLYREYCESNLTISEAARAIISHTEEDEDIYLTLAPPDLFSRTQVSGKTKASLFSEYGVDFTKTSNDREAGWLAVKELLRPRDTGEPRLKIFSQCREIIKCLPALQIDKIRPTDCANEPHEITHAPDALRGFAIFYARPRESEDISIRRLWSHDMWEDYNLASEDERKYLITKYGEPK